MQPPQPPASQPQTAPVMARPVAEAAAPPPPPPQPGAPAPPPPPMAAPLPPPPGTLPVPRPTTPIPPSTVASLDALPKTAMKKVRLAMIWFIVSGIIYIVGGSILYAVLADAQSKGIPVDATAMWSFIGILWVFGVLAILLAIVAQVRVLGLMNADKWDTAVDTMMFLAIPGFVFGLGLSGIWLYSYNKKMRKHPFYLRALPPPTPVCERCRMPVQWMPAMKKWYCPNCKIYL